MGISSAQQQRIARVLQNTPVSQVQIFGSRARGEAHRKSDYDLLIYFEDGYTPGLFDLGGLHHTLSEALGADVDLVTYRSSLPAAILKDAMTIFKRS